MKNSCIIYEGKSQIDGVTPIVCIMTGLRYSSNKKTGNVIQTWILRQDILPTEAIKTGSDGAICGDCKFKSGNGCYVNAGRAPNRVYRKYKEGGYDYFSKKDVKLLKDRVIRLGSYGEITAIPYIVVRNLIKHCKNQIGYTHAWGRIDNKWNKYIMASVDNKFEKAAAKDLGYRCFETLMSDKELDTDSIICPATTTKEVECKTCKLCSGNETKAKDIGVVLHGAKWKVDRATNQIKKSLS